MIPIVVSGFVWWPVSSDLISWSSDVGGGCEAQIVARFVTYLHTPTPCSLMYYSTISCYLLISLLEVNLYVVNAQSQPFSLDISQIRQTVFIDSAKGIALPPILLLHPNYYTQTLTACSCILGQHGKFPSPHLLGILDGIESTTILHPMSQVHTWFSQYRQTSGGITGIMGVRYGLIQIMYECGDEIGSVPFQVGGYGRS